MRLTTLWEQDHDTDPSQCRSNKSGELVPSQPTFLHHAGQSQDTYYRSSEGGHWKAASTRRW